MAKVHQGTQQYLGDFAYNPCCAHGSLYMLSRQLAKAMTEDGGWWARHRVGSEDQVTGQAVEEYTLRTRINVSRTWNSLGAWLHHPTASEIAGTDARRSPKENAEELKKVVAEWAETLATHRQ